MTNGRRVPDRQTRIDNARLGIIDDWSDDVDLFALDDWEILGSEHPKSGPVPDAPSRGTSEIATDSSEEAPRGVTKPT